MTQPPPRRRRLLKSLGAALLSVGTARALPAEPTPLRVIYPRLLERPEQAYGFKVLGLALRRSGRPHELRLGEMLMSSRVAWRELAAGRVDVIDNGSAGDLADQIALVPEPIDLGLGGCRLLLGRPEALQRLRGIGRIEELRAFSFGQGLDWTDGRILRHAGLRVEEGDFQSLLRMLQGGRFDLLPLSCDEAHTILERGRAAAPDVEVATDIGLVYPLPRVFYVTRGNAELQRALLLGLRAAREDGSLSALLQRTAGIGPILTGARPLPRTLIGLANPWLPVELQGLTLEQFHPALRAPLRALPARQG